MDPVIPINIISKILSPFSNKSGKKILAPISITANSSMCLPENFTPFSNLKIGIPVFFITIPTIKPVSNVSIIFVSIWLKINCIIIARIVQNNIPGKFVIKKSLFISTHFFKLTIIVNKIIFYCMMKRDMDFIAFRIVKCNT